MLWLCYSKKAPNTIYYIVCRRNNFGSMEVGGERGRWLVVENKNVSSRNIKPMHLPKTFVATTLLSKKRQSENFWRDGILNLIIRI